MERELAERVVDDLKGYTCLESGPEEFSVEDAMAMKEITNAASELSACYAIQKGNFIVWAEIFYGNCLRVKCFDCEDE